MTKDRNYAELVAEAEKAVTGVNDPELKRVAFQKVLDDLLAVPSETQKPTTPRRRRAPRATKGQGSPRSGPHAYITEMIGDGFFNKPKTLAQVKAELENRGHHIPLTSLSGPLQKLTQQRKLRRQRSKSGNKETFSYSEW